MKTRGQVVNGRIRHYQVMLKAGFKQATEGEGGNNAGDKQENGALTLIDARQQAMAGMRTVGAPRRRASRPPDQTGGPRRTAASAHGCRRAATVLLKCVDGGCLAC
ncbi:hypothetical protein [Azohydromonas australica]|uniref:hypothetical protein n=1 Tax=Azohydromonas australica TaxID=364039 RepID=UPI0012EB21A8|nr:hypothetical protein [Azohydromonas australica]